VNVITSAAQTGRIVKPTGKTFSSKHDRAAVTDGTDPITCE